MSNIVLNYISGGSFKSDNASIIVMLVYFGFSFLYLPELSPSNGFFMNSIALSNSYIKPLCVTIKKFWIKCYSSYASDK